MNYKLIFGFCVGLILFGPYVAFSAQPVVYFSDMTDGPVSGWAGSTAKGAAVSIWGNNFGSLRGSSYVTVGGVNLTNDSDYAEWGSTTNPSTARGLQRITFWLKSSMSSGDTTISVTTSDGTSQSIPFHTRNNGHIYFVSPSGNDDANGLTLLTAWETFTKVRETVTAGDVVYFRSGIWTATDTGVGSKKAVLKLYLSNWNNGTKNNSITLVCYPGEVAQIGDGTDADAVHFTYRYLGSSFEHWTFSKFKVNTYDFCFAWCAQVSGNTDKNIRIIGCDMTSVNNALCRGHLIDIYSNFTDLYIYGNYLHHAGKLNESDPDVNKTKAIYFSGGGVSNNVDVGWNELYKNNAHSQFFGHFVSDRLSNLKFHDNFVHDEGGMILVLGGGDPSSGTRYTFLQNAEIYNNIFSGQAGDLRVDWAANGVGGHYQMHNNTFYNNCSMPGTHILHVVSPASFEFCNNIVYDGPASQAGAYWSNASFGLAPPTNIETGNHNCWYGLGDGPAWDTNSLDNTDHQFIVSNPVNFNDFRLKDMSPINAVGGDIGVQFDSDNETPEPPPSDDEDPAITITRPTTAPEYETPLATISLEGTASDNVEVQSVTWTQNGSQPQNASGTTDWSIPSLTLVEGANNIVVTATYTSGNPASDTIVINYTKSQGTTYTEIFGNVPASDHPGTLQDTFNNANPSNQNYSTSTASLNTYTWPTDSVANRIVMKWDLSAIPSNATIHSAALHLYMYEHEESADDTYDVSVHKIVNRNPVIAACTWNTYDGVNAWTGGADGGAQDMATAEDAKSIDKTYGYKTWTVTNMVQDWVGNPSSSNLGMMLDSDSNASKNHYRYFRSTEYGNSDQRPKLVLTYSVGGDTTPPDEPEINTNGGSNYTTSDSSITFTGTCAADTYAVYVNGSTDGVGYYTPGETTWTYTGTLSQGDNTFDITAYDAAGNVSSADSITVTCDIELSAPTNLRLLHKAWSAEE